MALLLIALFTAAIIQFVVLGKSPTEGADTIPRPPAVVVTTVAAVETTIAAG